MITALNIYAGLRVALEEVFGEDVQIKDVKNIKRPCLYISFEGEKKKKTAPRIMQTDVMFEISYFGEESALLELFAAQRKLNDLVQNPLAVTSESGKTRYIDILTQDSDFDEGDYIVTLEITASFAQETDPKTSTLPDMNILELT